MANEYLKYTSKDYNSIYKDLISTIPTLTDLWTNTEEGDPGIVLVKLMSALGDMLSYNMDKQALEYYASTVTQRKNAAKLFNLIGYKMHWYRSATNKISVTNIQVVPNKYKGIPIYAEWLIYQAIPNKTTEQETKMNELQDLYIGYTQDFIANKTPETNPECFIYEEGVYKVNYNYILNNDESPLKSEYDDWVIQHTINIYTYIASDRKTISVKNGNRSETPYIIIPTTASNEDSSGNYLNSTDSIEPGQTHTFDVVQGSLYSIKFNSNRLKNNRFYFTESSIDENYIWLSYDSTSANRPTSQIFIDKTDNLLTITDDNIYFEFGIDDFDVPYIELSSYWVDKLADSVDFTVYYIRTSGVYGNITKNFLDTIEGISRNTYTITHPSNNTPYIDSDGKLIATPGYHPQTAYQAYKDSVNYVTTFNTIVTIYDFERFCKRQEGISNAYAVDKQRATDLNNLLKVQCENLSLAQLQAYYSQSKNKPIIDYTDIVALREFYMDRKTVRYNEYDMNEDYKAYGLNLHVVYGNFDLSMTYNDGVADITDVIAYMNNYQNQFWLYQISTNYEIEYVKTETGQYAKDLEGRRIPVHHDYDSIEDVTGDGRVAHYLDEKLRTTKIVNVSPEYASIRVFPWRCCGTIYLKNPVTKTVADKILETVMEHLSSSFHPANLEFGNKINYMDVIRVVTESHEMIRYFDAGLASRQLIDVDESVDISYFNNTSLMYYVQTADGFPIGGYYAEGNNTAYKHNSPNQANPYYKILSIAPEYIIE